ncbi:MAG: hypothetical protein ACE5J2_03790 [Nitrososphaerales archaeon]
MSSATYKPKTRSVIGTALTFAQNIALQLNWYGLYMDEKRPFKATTVMSRLIELVRNDKKGEGGKRRIPVDDQLFENFLN